MWTLKNKAIQNALVRQIYANLLDGANDVELLEAGYNYIVINGLRKLVELDDGAKILESIDYDFENISTGTVVQKYLYNLLQVVDTGKLSNFTYQVLANQISKNFETSLVFLICSKFELTFSDRHFLLDLIFSNREAFNTEEALYENPFGLSIRQTKENIISRAVNAGLDKKWLYLLSAEAILGLEGKRALLEVRSAITKGTEGNLALQQFYEMLFNKMDKGN